MNRQRSDQTHVQRSSSLPDKYTSAGIRAGSASFCTVIIRLRCSSRPSKTNWKSAHYISNYSPPSLSTSNHQARGLQHQRTVGETRTVRFFFPGPTSAVRSTGNRGSGLPFVHHDRLSSPSKLEIRISQQWLGQTRRSWALSKALNEAHLGKLFASR